MAVCEICRNAVERVTAFCPTCGAPLTALAARLREAERRPFPASPGGTVVLSDLDDAEADAQGR